MKPFLTAFVTSLIIAVPSAADGFEFEAGYARVTASDGGADLNFGSIYGIGGYRWNHGGNYSSSAEMMIRLGVQDDTFFDTKLELATNFGIGYKGTWQTEWEDTELFWRANYSQLTIDVAGSGFETSEDETDFGIGVGVVWKKFTIGYTVYLGGLDDFDSINIGYTF